VLLRIREAKALGWLYSLRIQDALEVLYIGMGVTKFSAFCWC
jgi:hypothetical protein